MLTFETSCLHGDIINVNPDHFVHITASARPHGAVKNCSLFELVKTNNQDQRKGDKIKPEPRAECRQWHRLAAWCFIYLRSEIWREYPPSPSPTAPDIALAYLEEGAIMRSKRQKKKGEIKQIYAVTSPDKEEKIRLWL